MECCTNAQRLSGTPDEAELEVHTSTLAVQIIEHTPFGTRVAKIIDDGIQNVFGSFLDIGIIQIFLIGLETPVIHVKDAKIETPVQLVGDVATEGDIVLIGMATLVYLVVSITRSTFTIESLY